MSTKVVQDTAARQKPPAAGKGRPKGATNLYNREVKEMILEALEGVGGIAYLMERANDPKTAAAFMTLVGKVMPTQVNMADANGEKLSLEVRLVRPAPRD